MSKQTTSRLGLALLGFAAIATSARSETSDSENQRSATTGALEEVVVTAEKEAESLQKTAAAVTAVAGERLVAAGVTDLRDTQMLIPAVRFQKEGNTTQVFVRGVGSNLDFANIEQTVAFNFNGVYVPREGTSTAFFDIASMEVLPGPQGTLYGRSAIGGAVNVTFARPEHGSTDGRFLLDVGEYELVHGSVAQNVSFSDSFSTRLAADYIRHDGYNESGADSQDDTAARLSFLYDPSDDLSFYFWTFAAQKKGHPPNLVNKGTDPQTMEFSQNAFLNSDAWNDLRLGSLEPLAPFGQPRAEGQTYENFAVGGQLDWKLGAATLTYVPGYVYLDSASEYWLGGIPAFISQHYNQSSHELRLSGASGPLEWLAGVYSYHQHNHGRFIIADVFVNIDIRDNFIQGTGVFGQGTYGITDTFRAILGGRYSSDKREAEGFQTADVATGEPLFPFTFDQSYSNIDWKIGFEWDVAPDVMTYATVQTAYAPGTYNPAPNTPTFDNEVKSPELTAFAAGFKSRFAGDTLQLNPEAFYYVYNDLIIQQFDQNVAFNPVFNAQEVRIYGAQVDLLWLPTSSDRINLNVGYTHARNEEFTTPNGGDFTGLQPPYSPDWAIIGGYGREFPLRTGTLGLRLDGRYESSWFADYVHNPGTRQKPSAKGDASLTYQADGDWEVGLWIKNFTNEPVLAATAAGGLPGPATCFLESPRTYGIRFQASY